MSAQAYVLMICVSALVLLLGFMLKNIRNLKKQESRLRANEEKEI